RTDRLRRVLDDRAIARPADGAQAFHGRHLAVEVHGHDGARPGRDGRLYRRGIDIERVRLDVHEHRSAARVVDRPGGGEERERGVDDLVPVPLVERLEVHDVIVGPGYAGSYMRIVSPAVP